MQHLVAIACEYTLPYACVTIPYSLNFAIIVVASSSPVVELASANPRRTM
jgi:hypothetical protein